MFSRDVICCVNSFSWVLKDFCWLMISVDRSFMIWSSIEMAEDLGIVVEKTIC